MSKKPKEAPPDDVGFIKDPDLWPNWPFLPVKKRGYGQIGKMISDKFGGVVLCDEGLVNGSKPKVYHVNLFDMPKSPEGWQKAEKTEYESIEAMVADGWMVD